MEGETVCTLTLKFHLPPPLPNIEIKFTINDVFEIYYSEHLLDTLLPELVIPKNLSSVLTNVSSNTSGVPDFLILAYKYFLWPSRVEVNNLVKHYNCSRRILSPD
jgi:hypothetical protein